MKRKKQRAAVLVGLAIVVVLAGIIYLVYPRTAPTSKTIGRVATATVPVGSRSGSGTPTSTQALSLPPQPQTAPHVVPTTKPTTAASAVQPTSTAAITGDVGFTLIYSDDFNGTQLSSTWGTYSGPHGGGKSYYAPSEVSVSGGLLHIGAERKTTGGLPITTGGLAAFGLAQVYGKYEFSARLPYGKGLDPYTILWPQSTQPNTAQVDLFESPPADKSTLYCTNHGADGSSGQVQAHGAFTTGFHTFTYEWTPGQIRFLVDGVYQGSLTNDVPNFPMWFGMAISSGDAFTGDPDPTTAFPVEMDVDWVHIYKYNG